jgi:hypothetical protein
MTPEEINKSVAEKVFNSVACDNWRVWHVARGEWMKNDESCGHKQCYPEECPAKYSTNIQASWQVVEKMREMGHNFSLGGNLDFALPFYASFAFPPLDNFTVSQAGSDTAPMAICLAALKAVS